MTPLGSSAASARSVVPVRVVDSHVHVWLDDRERFPRDDVPHPASPDLLLEYMDDAGVDRAVIMLPMHYGVDNRVLAHVLRLHPGRFAGVGVIDPRGEAAAARLMRLYDEDGIHGVRLRANLEEAWFDPQETAPLWGQAAALSVPLCVLGRARHLPVLRQMVERSPETPVVVDHLLHIQASDGVEGAAFQQLLALMRFPNVYLKLSALWRVSAEPFPYASAQPQLRAMFGAFGAGRIMWGSDWPHVLFFGGYHRCLRFVERELPWLSTGEQAQVLGGTARKLWGS